MPTPEASASSSLSVALRNTNITELAIEEADSFKANESTMTQDQCLDNGHQANSNNNRSSSDKVSDDLNNSKNSVVSNGVKSVQEFNVDVNREYSTDLVMVQNRTVDTDSPPTEEVLSPTTSKQLTETPSDFVDSKDILDNSKNNIDANKSECANNIVADMTVITHQNSSENIRNIIANSEKANNNSSDSHHQQIDRVVEKSPRSDINLGKSRSANRSAGTRRSRKLVRSENVNECEDVEIEDPIERLNKLRASISSALSEVKGVLKQYSTEQNCDDQNESAPSKQPLDDGPVRFRFVRKIRRRSVFSEDDTTEIPKTSTDAIALPIIENKVIEEVPKKFQDIQKPLSNENKDLTDQIKDEAPSSSGEVEKPFNKDKDEEDTKLIQTAKTDSSADIPVPHDKSDNDSYTVSEVQQKTTTEDSSIIAEVPSNTSGAPKVKNGKTKKILKKDRRASIAAVEINQISNDQLPIPEDLITQRRPSDSGTLVKQTTRIKAKTSEKPKLISSRKAKTGSSSSKTESSTTKLSQTAKAIEKTDTALSPTEEKTSSPLVDSTKTLDIKTSGTAVPVAHLTETTKPTVSVVSTSVISPQSTASPAILESKALEKTADLSLTSPLIAEANTPAVTSVAELKTPEVTPAPTASPTLNADVPKPDAPKVTGVNTPVEISTVKLNKPEATPAPAVTSPKVTEVNKLNTHQVTTAPAVESPVNTAVPQTSSKLTEVNASTGTNIKSNTPKTVTAQAVSTKVTDDLSQILAEMSVTSVKPSATDVPIPSQQSLKANPEPINKVGIPNQQTTKSKQLSHTSKIGTPSNKSNTPVSPAKTSQASPPAATVKVESSKSKTNSNEVLETKTVTSVSIQSNKKTKMITEAERTEASKAASVEASKTLQPAQKIVENKKSNESSDSKPVLKQSTTGTSKIAAGVSTKIDQKTSVKPHETLADEASGIEADVPKPSNVPKDAVAVKFNLPGQESVEELQRLEEQQDKEISPPQTPETPETPDTTAAAAAAAPPKKKRKAKRKVVIRRIKRKLSKDDTFIHQQEIPAELEICEKEIEEKDLDEQPEEEVPEGPKQPKSCLKNRAFEIGDVVMYAEHYKKTQVRWKKAIVTERITSISYKLNIEGGDERPAHISYIKKFTDRKVNFGGKEYLEIDYAQIEDDEEKERNYSIWNLV